MSTPSSRIINQLGLHGSSQGDAQMVEQLQLYKTPAIIRDMKQVFFYVQINANSTVQSPLTLFNNQGKFNNLYVAPIPPATAYGKIDNALSVQPYYTPLGTKRKFLLWEQINSLLDVRVPKDKYYLELKMSEAQIESDPTNWNKIRNQVATPALESQIGTIPNGVPAGSFLVEPSYDIEYNFGDPPTTGPGPGGNPIDGGLQLVKAQYFREATKTSRPQPLFVRIPQLNNGEPYNWTVVNNGANNDDKQHQTVVLHNDIKSQELELEFGHLMFKGRDSEYKQYGEKVIGDLSNQKIWNSDFSTGVTNPINNYQSFEYLDYNWEWANSDPKNKETVGATAFLTNNENRYLDPSARNGAIVASDGNFNDTGDPTKRYIATPPLKTNQQVSNILFRFEVKLIHLF